MLNKKMIHQVLVLTLSVSVIASISHAEPSKKFTKGLDYFVIDDKITSKENRNHSVQEFFWYGCPHCYNLEPSMQKWLKVRPKNVTFRRIPVAFNSIWEVGARTYYATEALGVRQKTHLAIFDAIHKQNIMLFSEQANADFLKKYGVNSLDFQNAYESPKTDLLIQQSNDLAKKYKLSGVPAIIVDNKYIIPGENSKVTDVLNYLISENSKID